MLKNIIEKIKKLFLEKKIENNIICFEWSEEENSQYERFAVEHFEECGIPTPWLCFKYANGKWYKKLVCPVCNSEYVIIKKKV